MPKTEFNHTIEDYLRAAYRVEERDGTVINAAIARELSVSPAAVSEMIRKMAGMKLLSYRKYHGSKLTAKGRTEAIAITRRHRLWEVFLIDRLEFGWDQVHDLADRLEHIRSDELINRLDDYLGNPSHDPHGDPIPTREGAIVERALTAIVEMWGTGGGVVRRVSDEYPELLRYAASLGLAIGARVDVIERIAFDGSVRLLANGVEAVISEKLAESVFVEIL